MGRAFIPKERRYADSGRGLGVCIGMIGEDKSSCEEVRR